MSGSVFANNLEISGKSSSNKTVAAMPDVCLSPPPPPAGPVPVPYPNFAQASDTTGGSKRVTIEGGEVSLKDKSSYKKSTGDEAATRNFGGGVLSHNITGPLKHVAGSFDVKVEGSNVVRFMDLTSSNHENPTNGPIGPQAAAAAAATVPTSDCEALKASNADARKNGGQAGKPSTVASFKVGKNGGGVACSSALSGKYKNASARGLARFDTGERTKTLKHRISDVKSASGRRKGKEASNLCEAGRKKHAGYSTTRSNARPKTGHAEAKIIEDLFATGTPAPGTIVTVAIDWPPKRDNPCEHCRRLICAAQECGVAIVICAKNNQAKSVEDKTKKKC